MFARGEGLAKPVDAPFAAEGDGDGESNRAEYGEEDDDGEATAAAELTCSVRGGCLAEPGPADAAPTAVLLREEDRAGESSPTEDRGEMSAAALKGRTPLPRGWDGDDEG